jgi:hypothetical protein
MDYKRALSEGPAAAPAPPPPSLPSPPSAPRLEPGGGETVEHNLRWMRSKVDGLPIPLRAAALFMLAIAGAAEPLLRKVWSASAPFVRFGHWLAVRLAPWVVWAVSRYVKWYVTSALNKVERGLKWAVWLLGLLPQSRSVSMAEGHKAH